ncbi:MAG: hypothetical protein ABSC25_14075 [Roseiarcus sp.]|jgi:hypothetical protein
MANNILRLSMKRALTISRALPLLLALTACDVSQPTVDQIAQQSMIGLSKKKIRVCMGAPAKRVVIGSTEIWTYSSGYLWTEGPAWAVGLNLGAPPFGPRGPCNVEVIMTNSRVSQVTYSAAGGGYLPLGQQCIFAVENCVKAW